MSTPNDAIASEFRRWRGAAQISQRALADAAGIPEGTYKRYESGAREIRVNVLAAVAAALGTTPIQLWREAEVHDPEAFGMEVPTSHLRTAKQPLPLGPGAAERPDKRPARRPSGAAPKE